VTAIARASVWRDRDFVRLWSAGTISVFGTLITRTALPFAAIIALGAGPIEISVLRSLELVAGLVFGLVAGAWVDRLRRRPILIAADLGRALLLGSIPLAAVLGVLGLGQLFVVAFLAAILSIFFDVADRSYLPTLVRQEELVAANSALTATISIAEFAGFGISGFLVQLVTAPIAIAFDAVSYVVSAVLIRDIRKPEPPRPPAAEREPLLAEIRDGLHLIATVPFLRSFTLATAFAHLMWGVFGATYILFAFDELGIGPALYGIIAGLGGVGSFAGALLVQRIARRIGVGRALTLLLVGFAVGNALIPLAPAGFVLLGASFLIGQQLLGDACATAFEILGLSVVQATVDDRLLGRANATIRSSEILLGLAGTLVGGIVGELVGLRPALWVGIAFAVMAIGFIWFSPIRRMREVPVGARTSEAALTPPPFVPAADDVPLNE
jgi:MFS family permease